MRRVRQLAGDPAQVFPDTAEGKQAMLARYRALLEEVDKGLGDAFDVRPRLGLEVKPVPEFAQATAPGAYYQPGAFDGSRPGVFYANMRNTLETPRFAMATLAYHEGIPGHHYQIAIAQELAHLPFFRRIVPFTAYSEGWALYAERLAWELGFEQDPLDNLGRLRDEMMRAVRLVVDTGIHAERWTREQAIAYMLRQHRHVRDRCRGRDRALLRHPRPGTGLQGRHARNPGAAREGPRSTGTAIRPQAVPQRGAHARRPAAQRAAPRGGRLDRSATDGIER